MVLAMGCLAEPNQQLAEELQLVVPPRGVLPLGV